MQTGQLRTRTTLATLLFATTLIAVTLAIVPPALPAAAEPAAITFTVNSAADVPDATPGDGVCETGPGNGICTLRAAVQETNKQATSVTIRLQGGVTYLLTRPGIDNTALNGDLDLTGTVTIEGAGPGSTIIDASLLDRVFEVTGTAVISGVTVQRGRVLNTGNGGGILVTGTLSVVNSRILSNTVSQTTGKGGGIYASGALTVLNSLVAGNVVTGAGSPDGGGIYAQSALRLMDSTIRNNFARVDGGGLYALSSKIINSTFHGNVGWRGGGLAGSNLDVINSTVSGNASDDDGGGIWGSALNLHNVTIVNNQANVDQVGTAEGGGLYAFSSVNLANSILSGNGVGAGAPFFLFNDCGGTVTSLGYNLIKTVSTCTIVGSYTNAAAALGPLQDNGGPTHTHALVPGGLAVEGGNPAGCTDPLGAPILRDQRGKPRPGPGSFTRCDLGAYEVVRDLFLPLIRR